jgi:hypothetical protein
MNLHYIQRLTETVEKSLSPNIGSASFMYSQIFKPIYDACLSKGRCPEVHDLRKRLEEVGGQRKAFREQGYLDSVVNRLTLVIDILGELSLSAYSISGSIALPSLLD